MLHFKRIFSINDCERLAGSSTVNRQTYFTCLELQLMKSYTSGTKSFAKTWFTVRAPRQIPLDENVT
jgi:hypothetical protein